MDSVEDSSASAEQPADSPQSEGSALLRCPKCDKTFAGDSGSTCSECGGELVPDTDSGPKKALLVDDSPLDQVKFEELLQGLGFDVTIASNGQEAISLLDEIQPDLIVMDVVMPGRGGISILQEIRTSDQEKHRSMPIVMLTGKDEPRMVKVALRYNPSDYILKTHPPEEIAERLRRFAYSGKGELSGWSLRHSAFELGADFFHFCLNIGQQLSSVLFDPTRRSHFLHLLTERH